jgi:hypothetical protein
MAYSYTMPSTARVSVSHHAPPTAAPAPERPGHLPERGQGYGISPTKGHIAPLHRYPIHAPIGLATSGKRRFGKRWYKELRIVALLLLLTGLTAFGATRYDPMAILQTLGGWMTSLTVLFAVAIVAHTAGRNR